MDFELGSDDDDDEYSIRNLKAYAEGSDDDGALRSPGGYPGRGMGTKFPLNPALSRTLSSTLSTTVSSTTEMDFMETFSQNSAPASPDRDGCCSVQKAVEHLSSKDFGVRQKGLMVLAEAGVAAAEHHSAVANLIDDKNSLVRISALGCLAAFGVRAGTHADKVAACIVGSSRPQSAGLKGAHDKVKLAAVDCLGKLGERGADKAIRFVSEDQPAELRKIGAKCLAELGAAGWKHVREIANCLSDKLDDVRFNAAQALGKLGSQIGPVVLPLFVASAWRTRKAAVQAIGNLGPPAREFIPYLVNMLQDEDKDVKVSALEAIGNIGDDAQLLGEVVAPLQYAQGLGAAAVQEAAKRNLPRIGRSDLLNVKFEDIPD